VQDVGAQVIEILGRYANPGRPLALTDRLVDLKIDSLSLMEVLFDLEEAFDIEIELNANRPEEQLEQWRDVGSAIATVERLVRTRSA
jgi:acyl carrier protein